MLDHLAVMNKWWCDGFIIFLPHTPMILLCWLLHKVELELCRFSFMILCQNFAVWIATELVWLECNVVSRVWKLGDHFGDV